MTLYTIRTQSTGGMVLTAMPPVVFLVEYAKHLGAPFVVLHAMQVSNVDDTQIDELRGWAGVEVFEV